MAENTQTQEEFLANFDWNKYQEGIDSIQEDQLKNFEELVKNNFVDTQDNEVVEGVVTRITDREAIIDINAKSEGVISLNEFRYNPNLKVGDKVEVLIDVREDRNGQLVLSHRKARTLKAWDRINLAFENGEIVNGFVPYQRWYDSRCIWHRSILAWFTNRCEAYPRLRTICK